MPAPRLLDKRLVSASLATERKQEIDKGIKLAKSVDALREARTKEEMALEDFRRETTARIQIQINAKIAERDAIASEIPRLKEERLLAQAPINLREEWQKVKEDRQANVEWQERNTQQALDLLAREEDSRILSEKLNGREKKILEQDALSLRTLEGAETKFTQVSEALERAEKESQAILQSAQERDNHSKVREEDATLREISLSKREAEVEAHEADLARREIKLKSRQEVFLKAQAYIKSKKK